MILKSSIKLESVTLESVPVTHLILRLFKISILIKQNHQRVPTSGGEKSRAIYLQASNAVRDGRREGGGGGGKGGVV